MTPKEKKVMDFKSFNENWILQRSKKINTIIMTPKDKAIDIYNYYEELIKDFTKGVSIKEFAKECALKNIYELLEVLCVYADISKDYEYWSQVKQELNKL